MLTDPVVLGTTGLTQQEVDLLLIIDHGQLTIWVICTASISGSLPCH